MWKKYFYKEFEKKAFINLLMGGLTAAGTLADIKMNKASVRLAKPGQFDLAHGSDPYAHQFRQSSNLQTPGRSLYS